MKIGQYCQRQRCRHVELEQFWQAFASCGFVSDSWAFLYICMPGECLFLMSNQHTDLDIIWSFYAENYYKQTNLTTATTNNHVFTRFLHLTKQNKSQWWPGLHGFKNINYKNLFLVLWLTKVSFVDITTFTEDICPKNYLKIRINYQTNVHHSVVTEDVDGISLNRRWCSQTLSNIGLQLICACSLAQSRKHPAILRCSEYVSSGGGVRRCFSITGNNSWILIAVLWRPKSKTASCANASPRIITASTWACCIAYKCNNYWN